MTFKPSATGGLSWSHLLTIVGLSGGLAAQWVSLSSRQAGVEATVAALQQTVAAIEARAHQMEEANRASDAELRAGIRVVDEKSTRILLLLSSTPPRR